MKEKTDLILGIVPLTDCAPIAVGVERGFFKRHSLNVTTSREESWASIRDKVAYGVLDGAQMIAPMAIATTLGIGGVQCDLVTGFNLDLNGNAITLDAELFAQMCAVDPTCATAPYTTAEPLRHIIQARVDRSLPKLRFGVVFPISTHDYEMRYWLASANINPDEDVELVVVPPSKMVDAMRSGHIAGFCVGEPWNTVAVEAGVGRVAITKHDIWNNSPEKVLGVTRQWHEQHPETHLALITALIEASRWIDDPEHRAEVCDILSMPQYVGVDPRLLRRSMMGTFRYDPDGPDRLMPDFNVFHRYAANFPWRSHAIWFMTQMLRWGQHTGPMDFNKVAAAVYRSDIYREAARRIGLPCPASNDKPEGIHGGIWSIKTETDSALQLGPDVFFDGNTFTPDRAEDYLRSFAVRQATGFTHSHPTDAHC